MKKNIFLSLLVFTMMAVGANAEVLIPATNQNIRYVGRVTLSKKMARFSYPGVQIRAVFEGTSLKMVMKPNSGYYMVELDNQEPFKIHCSETDSVNVVATGLTRGRHNVIISMANEGYKMKPQFHGFLLDDGCTLPEAPVLPKRKIEFIGNSITCGFGVEGQNAKEKFSFETENQYYAFDAITARMLDAQCMVVARSGMGVYKNYGGKVTGDKTVMPTVYPFTLFDNGNEKWDFSRFTPDVVCINMGTNDTSYGKWDSKLFKEAYYKFLLTIRGNYPDAAIVILSGTMISGGTSRDIRLRKDLDDVRDRLANGGDTKVYRFDMTPEDGSMGWGSCYHPSRQRQQFMAEELSAYLKDIMNWK